MASLTFSAAAIGFDYVSGQETAENTATAGYDSDIVSVIDSNNSYQPDGITVVTSVSGAISSAEERGALFVVAPDGRLIYEEHRYNIYDDVNPSPVGDSVVTYVSAIKLSGEECAEFETSPCTLNFIERLDFETGERERLYAAKTPRVVDSRWHDADRINETHFSIADISEERLLIVDITTDEITHEWQLDSALDRNTTGATDEPHDWAHLNDVERLDDGTYMLSLRNHDQVIFYRIGEGMLEERTLGQDNNYSILYEQHNPDYLYGPEGTESVLVADSQNNRIVEYEWRDGWRQTWVWTDKKMRWPRDADRLPNGNTLVSDTGSDRILEVTPSGNIVWGISVKGNYEAERLGTGDESQNGLPMSTLDGTNLEISGDYAQLPPKLRLLVNGLLFVTPPWVKASTLLFAALGIASGLGLTVFIGGGKLRCLLDSR